MYSSRILLQIPTEISLDILQRTSLRVPSAITDAVYPDIPVKILQAISPRIWLQILTIVFLNILLGIPPEIFLEIPSEILASRISLPILPNISIGIRLGIHSDISSKNLTWISQARNYSAFSPSASVIFALVMQYSQHTLLRSRGSQITVVKRMGFLQEFQMTFPHELFVEIPVIASRISLEIPPGTGHFKIAMIACFETTTVPSDWNSSPSEWTHLCMNLLRFFRSMQDYSGMVSTLICHISMII